MAQEATASQPQTVKGSIEQVLAYQSQLKLSFGANTWSSYGHLNSEIKFFKMRMVAGSRV